MKYSIRPLTQRQAKAFVDEHHRHNKAPRGDVIRVGLNAGDEEEITRLCILDDHRNGCSQMYGALRRAAKALGYHRLYTYTLATEPGSSLKASGWTKDADLQATQGWARTERDREPLLTDETSKVRWTIQLAGPN